MKNKIIDKLMRIKKINMPSFNDLKDKINNNNERNYYSKTSNHLLKYLIISFSCLIFVFLLGFSGYQIKVEAAEYKEAIEFFEKNDLKIEGLSRSEIKKVYKDIKTNSFVYSVTGIVVTNSIQEKVPGYVISSNDYKSMDLKSLWELLDDIINNTNISGVTYDIESTGGYWESEVYIPYESRIVKYNDGLKVWEYDITNINIRDFKVFDNILIGYSERVYKDDSFSTRYDGTNACIIFLDTNDGKLLYKNTYNNNPEKFESTNTIIDNKDNTYTLVSSIDQRYLCLTTINDKAEIIKTIKKDYTKCIISCVTTFDNGYLVLFSSFYLDNTQKVMKVDKEANCISEFSYTNDDSIYVIKDMIEYHNRIYLSCYEYPKQDKSNRREISDILDYIDAKIQESGYNSITDEEVTKLVRDNYKATLLVCDFDKGNPELFYSVDASLGSTLIIDEDGRLVWNIEEIVSAIYSPATSSFTIGGICNVYEYLFDETGKMLSKEKTGEQTILSK